MAVDTHPLLATDGTDRLVAVFCGTCNIHTNAGRRQSSVQARPDDVSADACTI